MSTIKYWVRCNVAKSNSYFPYNTLIPISSSVFYSGSGIDINSSSIQIIQPNQWILITDTGIDSSLSSSVNFSFTSSVLNVPFISASVSH